MDNKQYRMLQLLDRQILECKKCGLYNGGRCVPYYTSQSTVAMIGEAPGREEVGNMPFVGKAGRLLWEVVVPWGLVREDFLIINSTNCRPVDGNKNGKPTKLQQRACKFWIDKYLKVLQPEKILVLGNYAMNTMIGLDSGITDKNGEVRVVEGYGKLVLSVHPSYCLYHEEEGKELLNESIRVFKEI